MKLHIIVLFVVLLVAGNLAYGQKIRRTNNFDSYKDHVNELGYAMNLSYLKYEKSLAPQLHVHYTHYLTQFFSLGLGYSAIYDIHFHNTISLESSFCFNRLIFSFKPGVVIKNVHSKSVVLYSMGFEANYEFKINDRIHIGPMVEIDVVQDDTNYLMGLHMGITF